MGAETRRDETTTIMEKDGTKKDRLARKKITAIAARHGLPCYFSLGTCLLRDVSDRRMLKQGRFAISVYFTIIKLGCSQLRGKEKYQAGLFVMRR